MKDANLSRKVAGLVRLRQRMRMMGSAMLSADAGVVSELPISMSAVFACVEELDAVIKDFDSALLLSGGGGD